MHVLWVSLKHLIPSGENGLLHKLIKNGLSYKFISFIKSMYEDIKMAVKLPGGLTPFFESLVGVRKRL